jgi:hypothetical protein
MHSNNYTLENVKLIRQDFMDQRKELVTRERILLKDLFKCDAKDLSSWDFYVATRERAWKYIEIT